jgi:PTH1 family peptidyl-tRNA hydrolase
MNLSGPALHDFLNYKQLALDPTVLAEQLLVIHDELDFPVGQLKIQTARSSAGHNGVQSIIDTWHGWQGFSRLRVGIGDNRSVNLPAEDYVLRPFTAAEQPVIDQQIKAAVELLRLKLA